MTTTDNLFRAWADQAMRPVIREILRDELADILPAFNQDHSSTPDNEIPLSVKQAAEFLGIAEQTVYQNIKKVPHKKRFGRLYFFPAELRAYLNAGEGAIGE
jgi:predicted DNA-binding transcriptional regulator AlpA